MKLEELATKLEQSLKDVMKKRTRNTYKEHAQFAKTLEEMKKEEFRFLMRTYYGNLDFDVMVNIIEQNEHVDLPYIQVHGSIHYPSKEGLIPVRIYLKKSRIILDSPTTSTSVSKTSSIAQNLLNLYTFCELCTESETVLEYTMNIVDPRRNVWR